MFHFNSLRELRILRLDLNDQMGMNRLVIRPFIYIAHPTTDLIDPKVLSPLPRIFHILWKKLWNKEGNPQSSSHFVWLLLHVLQDSFCTLIACQMFVTMNPN